MPTFFRLASLLAKPTFGAIRRPMATTRHRATAPRIYTFPTPSTPGLLDLLQDAFNPEKNRRISLPFEATSTSLESFLDTHLIPGYTVNLLFKIPKVDDPSGTDAEEHIFIVQNLTKSDLSKLEPLWANHLLLILNAPVATLRGSCSTIVVNTKGTVDLIRSAGLPETVFRGYGHDETTETLSRTTLQQDRLHR